ncbi:MAG: hypothetical protein EKK29_13275 [Hyphomicrobiales bacterium]|nr:MAG: hypothetical protein EKK29_13275 [Hyphomicrobiales bacterium]
MKMKKPSKFLQGDVSRAIKGALAGGFKFEEVRVEPDGTIVIASSQRLAAEHDALGVVELDARLERDADGKS